MIRTLLLVFTSFLVTVSSFAQNTVGLLSYQPSKTFNGYNLMYPHNQPTVYLLDNCGEIVQTWTDESNFRPGNTAYLRPDGTLVKTKRDAVVTDDAIWAGGGGEFVEIREWDNTLVWSFELNNETSRLHHDIAPMPNGNILMTAWELKTANEAIAAGRDTALLSQGKLWPDYIIEVDPSTDQIVWEWHTWDHLIQDHDSEKANFGVVEDHPELIDLNWDTSDGHPDWMHGNAIDYNPELDQILLSVPTFSEVWIIDHTTSTAEAAGHTGGMSGRGGDLMYRWGNPATYRAGTVNDQKLFYPHDIHWVDEFVDFSFPQYGKIAAFNNRVGADFSTANVFNPPWDMYSWSYTLDATAFGPANFDITITHPTPTNLYSTGLSSVQLLPNGNTLICSGRFGYAFEITTANEIVWEYKTPLINGFPATQGDTLIINNNLTFRFNRYPDYFSAFDGKDLSQKGWIENEPDTTYCDLILPIDEIFKNYKLTLFPNPANDMVVIEWEGGMYSDFEIFDILGRYVYGFRASGGRKYLDVAGWEEGIYFVRVDGVVSGKLVISR
jgi:arylsulfotransferase ASST/type IX secretion system substrate protein